MEEDDVDLEDLENRLYSEVYHSRPDEIVVDPCPSNTVNIEIPETQTTLTYNYKSSQRYFKTTSVDLRPTSCIPERQNVISAYPFPPLVFNPVHNVILISPTVNAVPRRNFQKLRRAERRARKKQSRALKRLEAKQSEEEIIIKEPTHIRFPNEQFRFDFQSDPKKDEVICISDGEDCIIVNPNSVKNEKEGEITVRSVEPILCTSSDDDDIDAVEFIEPPPIPVIDLDPEIVKEPASTPVTAEKQPDSNKSYSPIERTDLLDTPESNTSNDFIENSSVDLNETSFNFSLHGAEFNSADGEFVRPANPTDVYETESSCSTTDFNKDLNSTLKSGVFNEVEFPKEDIFAENNLEAFGDYITPKRCDAKVVVEENTSETSTVSVQRSYSSDSSSEESDSLTNVNRSNLPELSPMNVESNVAGKVKRKSEQSVENESKKVKKKNKRKLGKDEDTDTSQSANIEDNASSSSSGKSKKKKKKRSHENKEILDKDQAMEAVVDVSKSKKKKKRNASENNNEGADDFIVSVNTIQELSNPSESIILDQLEEEVDKDMSDNSGNWHSDATTANKKKKKRRTVEIPEDTTPEVAEQPLKSKKKKKTSLSENWKSDDTPQIANEEDAEVVENSSGKPKKKKKRSICDNVVTAEEANEIITENENLEDKTNNSNKQKKNEPAEEIKVPEESNKKRKSSLTEANLNVDQESSISAEAANKEKELDSDSSGRSRKKKKRPEETSEEVLLETPEDSTENSLNDNSDVLKPSISEEVNKLVGLNEEDAVAEEKPAKNELQDNETPNHEEIVVIEDDIIETSPLDNNTNLTEEDSAVEVVNDISFGELIVIDEVGDSENEVVDENTSGSEHSKNDVELVETDLSLANCDVSFVIDTSPDPQLPVDRTPFKHRWTPDKKAFYLTPTNSNFDVDAIQSTMKDDPNCWQILPRDRFNLTEPNRGPRCHNCREFGHKALRCPNRTDEASCALCGQSGHAEPRCPNKMCTQCGNEGSYSTNFCWKCVRFRNIQCNLCKMYGHQANKCPDLWRRYHLTTEEGPLIQLSEPQLKAKNQLWCSACAKPGHLEQSCNYINRTHPPSDIQVHSYEDIYGFDRPNRKVCLQQNSNQPLNLIIQLPNNQNQVNSVTLLPQNAEQVHVTTNNNFTVVNAGPTFSDTGFFTPISVSMPQEVQSSNRHITMRFFRDKSTVEIQRFLNFELNKINNISQSPKVFRKRLCYYENLSKRGITKLQQKQYSSWCRKLNMFVFGLHKLHEGKNHMENLHSTLARDPSYNFNRDQLYFLCKSYNYVFGGSIHPFVNYNKLLQVLILKSNRQRV